MMQFFITTRPDREKALSYFNAMLQLKVAPTGHTYKLLLDAYGSLEPSKQSRRNPFIIHFRLWLTMSACI